MLLETVLLGVILVAIGYWATMYTMGRRDDVIHGKFVQDETAEPAPPVARTVTRMPPLPTRPAPVAPHASRESLQSLLAVIKQDLKDAAQV
jgi:hypothetical protein